jgi:uncharacterized protein (DUF1501 family)
MSAMENIDIGRRRLSGLLVTASILPWFAAAARGAPRAEGRQTPKRLIVVELQGGNDSLNTVVPWSDPLYRRYRPTLAVPDRETIRLTDEIALNGALAVLARLYQEGCLAIVQDVGYPHPNLSHFESGAIWSSGRLVDIRESGWVARVVAANRSAVDGRALDADGIVLGGNGDALAGPDAQVLAIDDVPSFLAAAPERIHALSADGTQAERYILDVISETNQIAARLRSKLTGRNRFNDWFSGDKHYVDPFSSQIANVLWMMESGVDTLAYKITLASFDMHTHLRGQHEELLRQFDTGMAALVRGLKEIGAWSDTLVMAYSEFGRRPAENASGGTDHGTAGAMFLLGGGLRGGLHGTRADLAALDENGNPVATTDFRSVYAAIVEAFWTFGQNPIAGVAPLPTPLFV